MRRQVLVFLIKFTQPVRLIERLAGVFIAVLILVVTDNWFGNQGLLKPLRAARGPRSQFFTRLPLNTLLHELPGAAPGSAGCRWRPKPADS